MAEPVTPNKEGTRPDEGATEAETAAAARATERNPEESDSDDNSDIENREEGRTGTTANDASGGTDTNPSGANAAMSAKEFKSAKRSADGSRQQQGVDYEDNFAPVVAWSTVCLILTIATLLNLNMRQIDFTQAFPQAECTEDTYMYMPDGWTHVDENGNSDYVLKLQKNLYGTATGTRNWYKKLASGLEARGFTKSRGVDPCLFLRDDCIVVVYTNDCICFSRNSHTVTTLIADLKSDGFLLKDKGDAKDFLGVRIERDAAKFDRVQKVRSSLISTEITQQNSTTTSFRYWV